MIKNKYFLDNEKKLIKSLEFDFFLLHKKILVSWFVIFLLMLRNTNISFLNNKRKLTLKILKLISPHFLKKKMLIFCVIFQWSDIFIFTYVICKRYQNQCSFFYLFLILQFWNWIVCQIISYDDINYKKF